MESEPEGHVAMTSASKNGGAEIGLVYILSNPALKGLLIIGFTINEGIETKISQLNGSIDLSLPFEEVFSLLVTYPNQYKSEFEARFRKYRVPQGKGLFKIDADTARAEILKMLRYSGDHQTAKMRNTLEAVFLAEEDEYTEFFDKEYSLEDQIAIAKELLMSKVTSE
ncbi:MAG: GIY-YIG nuclease family protein, partial [Proteobacteria bacterium]|nr:GIY-YIG nuclease family protein [Pseudomonadota bacterium]